MAPKPITHPKYFEDLLQTAIDTGQVNDATRQSIEYFRKLIKESARPAKAEIMRGFGSERYRNKGNIHIGGMYTFYYDPKLKHELPYYDLFPLILVVDIQKDRIHGLNLHYLSPYLRSRLFQALVDDRTTIRYGNSTRINVNYGKLKSISKLKWFKPCYKEYITSHFRSRLMYIHPTEWNMAVFMPTQDFQKKTAQYVWAESQKIVTGSGPRAGGREYARGRAGNLPRKPNTSETRGNAAKPRSAFGARSMTKKR